MKKLNSNNSSTYAQKIIFIYTNHFSPRPFEKKKKEFIYVYKLILFD